MALSAVLSPPRPDLGPVDYGEAWDWNRGHPDLASNDGLQTRQPTAPDFATATFELDSGTIVTLQLAQTPALRNMGADLEIHGSDGSLLIDRLGGAISLGATDPGTPTPTITTESVGGVGTVGNRFAQFALPALRAQIEGRPIDFPGLDDGVRAQEFVDAVVRSSATGRWVEMASGG